MSQNLRNRSRGVPPDVVDGRRRRRRRVRNAVFAGLGIVAGVVLVVVSLCGVPTVLTLLLTTPPHTYGSTSSLPSSTSSPMWTPLTLPSGAPDESANPTPDATVPVPQRAAAITATPPKKSSGASTSSGVPKSTPTATPSPSQTAPGKSGSAHGHSKTPGKTPSPTPSPIPSSTPSPTPSP